MRPVRGDPVLEHLVLNWGWGGGLFFFYFNVEGAQAI